jgi:phosphate transporter
MRIRGDDWALMRQLGEYILVRGLTSNIYGVRSWIFSVMFSPTIMLLIGGFTIAAALSKTNIDRVLITRVLSLAGTRPNVVLLAVMGVACFASMWIRCGDSQAPIVSLPRVLTLSFPFSNVAAPTLCFTLVRVRWTISIFHFAFRTLTLLIVANLADSPTEGILWALPCRECSRPYL